MPQVERIPTRYMAAMTFRSNGKDGYGMTACAPFEVQAMTAAEAYELARATVRKRPDFRSFINTSVEVIGS